VHAVIVQTLCLRSMGLLVRPIFPGTSATPTPRCCSPVKAVSERLGHASATITLTVHQHVHPGMGREAADHFAPLLAG